MAADPPKGHYNHRQHDAHRSIAEEGGASGIVLDSAAAGAQDIYFSGRNLLESPTLAGVDSLALRRKGRV
jgi:hypothetical protein